MADGDSRADEVRVTCGDRADPTVIGQPAQERRPDESRRLPEDVATVGSGRHIGLLSDAHLRIDGQVE